MKVFNYRFERAKRELQSGWEPSWSRYCRWLKERSYRIAKDLVEANLVRERREHNDKVLRSYGLGKYQHKGGPYV